MIVINILFNCLCIAIYKSETNKGEVGRKPFSVFLEWDIYLQNKPKLYLFQVFSKHYGAYSTVLYNWCAKDHGMY